jgi:hypothetical protein
MEDGRKISINPEEYMDFMKNSQQIFLPEDNINKRKIINKNFHGSCMLVKIAEERYIVGRLNWTSSIGYSMTVDGKEMLFSYCNTEAIFKPKLC